MRFRFLFVLAAFLAQPAFAEVAAGPAVQTKSLCKSTSSSKVDNKPTTFNKIVNADNDTTKAAGQFDNPYLSKILIRGLVKDKNCVPIPNVTVEIWQADEYGLNRYNKFSALFLERYQENYESYSDFLGIATATSDNNGYFTFVSVLPNKKAKAASKSASKTSINVSATHRDFSKLETRLHMVTGDTKHARTASTDSKLLGYRNLAAEKKYGMPTYDVELVMDGTNKYKTY